MAGLKLNIWTIAGGLVLLGGAYFVAKQMNWLPPEWVIMNLGGGPARVSGVPGYSEDGGYSTAYDGGYGSQSSDFGMNINLA